MMEEKYQQQAKDAGVFIVSACGFDSIPHDVGMRFTEENFSGTCVLWIVQKLANLKNYCNKDTTEFILLKLTRLF